MEQTLLEIVRLSQENHLNPVAEIRDYLWEKDSPVTWREAARLVAHLLESNPNQPDERKIE